MDELHLKRACEALVSAFAGDEDFAAALDLAARAAGARGTAIIPLAADNHHRPVSHAIADLADAYNSHWHQHDFRFASLDKMLRSGVAVDQDIITADGMARLPYYTDFLARHGLRWFSGIPFRDRDEVWCLTFQRTPDQGLFDAAEQDALRRFGCVLSQSVSTARIVAAAWDGGLLEGLSRSGTPALLLDRKGRLVQGNDRVTLELKRDLRLATGRPLLASTPLAPVVATRVEAMLRPGTPDDGGDRLPLVVPRSGQRPLVIRLRALRPDAARFYEKASVVAIVDDPDRHDRTSVALLAQVFGLTPGQARIAVRVGAGRTIAQTAHDLGIDVETVRSGLHKSFQKLGVNRQVELVQVISRLPSI